MNKKIVIIEKSISNLIGHDGKGKRVHSATIIAKRDADISPVIFKEGANFVDENGPSTKDLTNNLRVWFKIILGCINHMPSTNSYDYINTHQWVDRRTGKGCWESFIGKESEEYGSHIQILKTKIRFDQG